MTIRDKVGNCISKYGEIANEKGDVDFEWTIIKEEDFNFRVLGLYLTMLQYEGLGEEKIDEIVKCLLGHFAKKKKDVYVIDYSPFIKTQEMPYPIYLQLNYLVCVWYREHYLICEDFFYLSQLHYKYVKDKQLDLDEVTEGEEKCEHFNNIEFDKIIKAYESCFATLGGRIELRASFNDIRNSITNAKYVDYDSDSAFHGGAQ